jgi:hypothetical protein
VVVVVLPKEKVGPACLREAVEYQVEDALKELFSLFGLEKLLPQVGVEVLALGVGGLEVPDFVLQVLETGIEFVNLQEKVFCEGLPWPRCLRCTRVM